MTLSEVRAMYEQVKDAPEHWSVYQRIKRLCEHILSAEGECTES